MKPVRLASAIACMVVSSISVRSAEIPKAPVPPSPYLRIVYSYADALLKSGRDRFGEKHTGLFLSALDRAALEPLGEFPPPPSGLDPESRCGRASDRLAGASPQHDQNLLRLLHTLSELSSKPDYRAAAEAELKWVLTNPASTGAGVSAWCGNGWWDTLTDAFIRSAATGISSRAFRPWMLWDRCFDVAPDASRSAAMEWTPDDSAVARSNGDRPSTNDDSGSQASAALRETGISIRTWAVASARTGDVEFARRIGRCLDRLRKPDATADPGSLLSLAIDCDGAAHRVPEPLASRLRTIAEQSDAAFLSQSHDLKKSGGFAIQTSQSLDGEIPTTPLWTCRSRGATTAQIGMMCVSRCDNTGKTAFRDLVLATAGAYRESMPGADDDSWPLVFGHAISLQIAAWRHTANRAYLDRARALADFAVTHFWADGPLPKASLKSNHYESATGGDTLALALTELHLTILAITAVRCPPNTIDR